MLHSKLFKGGLIIFSLFLLSFHLFPLDAEARMGGGRSMGSRGFRSFSAPSSPSSIPTSPSRQYNSSNSSSPFQQRQSGGFLRSMAGGVVGGMLGGMLFRSLGMSGFGGMGGGGIGFFEILLIGLIGYGIWRYIAKKKIENTITPQFNYGREASSNYASQPGAAYTDNPPDRGNEVDNALGQIRSMDPAFEVQKFHDMCMDIFFKVQGAWANRDMTTVRNLFTNEMFGIIQGDAEDLKRNKKINRLDNIAVRTVEITEAWQESGSDFITVRFYANLLDYTIDETSGQVLAGSKTDPVKFVEFWTFTRPVGNNPWQLSALSQG